MLYKLFVCILFISGVVTAQNGSLQKYIEEGLKNNLALQQKQFSLNKSIAALDEARGMFFPSLEINARYSRAGGGRTIDFPIGQIVNPIYSGLNSLIGSQVYPTNIQNETIYFLRRKEHETKLSIVQPIFKPSILYNYNLKSDLSKSERSARDVYARELVKEIKTAYYNFLKTAKVVDLYDGTEKLVEENLRVSKALYKNQKATLDVIYRAEAELSSVQEKKIEAVKNNDLAKSYFNFLLNRPFDEKIAPGEIVNLEFTEDEFTENLFAETLSKREELNQLTSAINASESAVKINSAEYLPGVVLAVVYGFQGEQYRFRSEDDYWMASLVLQWNLFNGFQDAAKVEQAEWNKKELEIRKQEIKKSIMLQVREAVQNLNVAKEKLQTSKNRKTSSEESFKIISKKFENGLASQIEFLDARTNLTNAAISEIIAGYDYLINKAELERVTAGYSLPFNKNDK